MLGWVALAVAGGLLWAREFGPRGFRVEPWVALVPLLLLLGSPRPKLLGFLHGVVFWVGSMPWIASTLVGCTLGGAATHPVRRFLSTATLRYVAEISFALYVVHGCLVASWLETGDKLVKYAKRPLFIAATWGLAHLSTRYYEAFFIRLGKRLAGK